MEERQYSFDVELQKWENAIIEGIYVDGEEKTEIKYLERKHAAG